MRNNGLVVSASPTLSVPPAPALGAAPPGRVLALTLALAVAVAVAACSGPEGGASCDEGCSTPPAAQCDGDSLLVPQLVGTCVDGACDYAAERVPCPGGCQDGACIDVADPCDGVVCDAPPQDACEGDTAVTFQPRGVCSEGRCDYTRVEDDCAERGRVCRDAECVRACAGVVCDAPPPPGCDGRVAVSYADEGECDDGRCTYEEARQDCTADEPDGTCSEGVCVRPDRCADVSCDTPPAASCDGDTRIWFTNGSCVPSTGECAWSRRTTRCADEELCRDGECVPDPCLGVDCQSPPEGRCEGDRAFGFEPTGVCSDGACDYTAAPPLDCAGLGRFCAAGRCVDTDPCVGLSCDTPPASRCDGGTAVAFTRGLCRFGECAYTEVRTNCTVGGQVCLEGTCVDPGVDCATLCPTPPPDVCEGAVAVRYAATASSCVGACVWPEAAREDCAASGRFCSEGSCVDVDPCSSTVCDTPPAARCDGVFAVTHDATGTCGPGGACAYPERRRNCVAAGAECVGGACVFPDPCEGVVCDTPPASACDLDILIGYEPEGTCVAGRCEYAEADVDCAIELPLGYCSDGECLSADPCWGVSCIAPPAPVCDGDTVLTYAALGTCSRGRCSYGEGAREDCSRVTGGFCFDGACGSRDPCFGVTCAAPPAPRCDGDTAVVASTPGACLDGRCRWTESRVDCTETGRFCFAGACQVPSPCVGVVCNRPPTARCEADVAVWFASAGVCSDGFCSYAENRVDCTSNGGYCREGVCQPADPCRGVTCDEAPAPTCDGHRVVEFRAPGVCNGGACVYDRLLTPCNEDPLGTCRDGACVTVDPCDELTCDTPPPPVCDGRVSVRFSTPGSCADGRCGWQQTRVDCAETGRYCSAGACVDADPCDTIRCTNPPVARCEGDVRVAFGFPGTCSAGECSYARATENCAEAGEICSGGLCVPNRVCEGVLCDDPPPPVCSGNAVLEYVDGACVGGACAFTTRRTDCAASGRFCLLGACVDEDPCEGAVCNFPPGGRCAGNVATRYAPTGSCLAGTCSYESTVEDCAATGRFCRLGACVEVDPCGGVDCSAAPPSACVDGLRLATYAAPGTCSGGECNWSYVARDCSESGLVCRAGACVEGDVCGEIVCDLPPGPRCEGRVAVSSSMPGSCVDERCSYAETRTDCSETGSFCSAGRCVASDPCVGVTCDSPPAARCQGNTVLTFAASGTCSDGACTYTPTLRDCAAEGAFCSAGACVPTDPCAALSCDTPPAPACNGPGFVVTYSLPGTCTFGECAYAQSFAVCGPGLMCEGGACVTDPCAGVVCDSPPPDVCVGDTLVYSTGGSCASGTCAYETATYDCSNVGLVCEGGACVRRDLCEGVTCDAPPPAFCNGSVARAPEPDGACLDGDCMYVFVDRDCSEFGLICVDGACVADPCSGVACDAPPADYCVGRELYGYQDLGTCRDGECTYTGGVRKRDCRAEGLDCRDGACVPPDACTGVLCAAPPPPDCDGRVAVTAPFIGTCTDGACSYPVTRTDCAATGRYCLHGSCVEFDPCADVDCSGFVPFPYCEANVRTVPTGVPYCNSGICFFPSKAETDCGATGQFCVDGACTNDDPCVGVVCNDPPPAGCLDDTYVEPEAPGTCTLGQCQYPGTTTDCAAIGQSCTALGCDEDPCAGLVCAPLGPFCDGNTRVVTTGPGGCDLTIGDCDYRAVQVRTDCTATGQICALGACRDPDQYIGVGDLAITEFMVWPSGDPAGGQWIEIRNVSGRTLGVEGLVVVERFGGDATAQQFTVTASLELAPGAFAVFAEGAGAAGGAVDFVWPAGAMRLRRDNGAIELRSDGQTVAGYTWVPFLGLVAEGRAAQYDAGAPGAGTFPRWCLAAALYDGVNAGSPGAPNPSCD